MPDTETTIQPALTPEEWAKHSSPDIGENGVGGYFRDGPTFFWTHKNGALNVDTITDYDGATSPLDPDARHAAAALALYGQPFGFTHEDVAALNVFVERARDMEDAGPIGEGWQSDELIAGIAAADRIIERLTALLPPK